MDKTRSQLGTYRLNPAVMQAGYQASETVVCDVISHVTS